MTVTYAVGALGSLILYFILGRSEGTLIEQYSRLNWAPFILGLVIIGLEAGWIYAYKAGWPVSTGFITQASILAAVLIAVGAMLYGEKVTLTKMLGVGVCLIGLFLINAGK